MKEYLGRVIAHSRKRILVFDRCVLCIRPDILVVVICFSGIRPSDKAIHARLALVDAIAFRPSHRRPRNTDMVIHRVQRLGFDDRGFRCLRLRTVFVYRCNPVGIVCL